MHLLNILHRRTSNSPLYRDTVRKKHTKASNRSRRQSKNRVLHEPLEARTLLTVATFQQGVGGYTDTHDTDLFSGTPNVNLGTDAGISVDQQDANAARQGLVKFANIFTSTNEPGKIPLGSTINSATLRMRVFNETNSSAQISVYRMLVDWNQNTATWNNIGFGPIGGVQASEGEAEAVPDYVVPDPNLVPASPISAWRTFDVATSLKHWASGEGNYGWLFDTSTTNGWDFDTSESTNPPQLEVDYTAPSGNGTFQFLNLTPTQTEGNTGTTTALLKVARLGGTTGAVSVDYTIAAGGSNPATAGVDFVAAGPTTISFADGETVKTVPVVINGDTALEGSETVSITLSNAQGGATINGSASNAILTIADDDALINEVLANIDNATHTIDETNKEYIELAGTPNASLDGYYVVVFDGQGNGSLGANIGIARNVFSLSGQHFGANGLLVITPTAWAYTPDAGTNQFATSDLDGAGGRLGDSSQTYALIKSPTTAFTVGTGYDTIGTYDSDSTSIDVGAGVGILDRVSAGGNFPNDADIVDSVGVNEGGGNDKDRVLTFAAPGVHVHEPIGNNGNVAPDVITRRDGNNTPNSIGPWYCGEMETATIPLVYSADPKRSVVTPAGATATPGARNILRNIGFTATATSVDESTGTVTVTVKRTGDTSSAISVNYATASGSAISGVDFTPESGPLSFGIGVDSRDITIPITVDSVSEGFETFTVNLSSATVPFQITAPRITVTINDANVLLQTFQDSSGGYTGTSDATLNAVQPNDPFGGTFTNSVDQTAGSATLFNVRPAQTLLRFDSLFGSALGQVPAGSHIFGAFLTVNVVTATASDAQVRLFRMLQNWDETTATWTNPQGSAGSSIANGITPDDVEATAEPDAIVTSPGAAGFVDIPLNLDTVQAWADGSLANYGWAIISNSGTGWNFESADTIDGDALKPKLTILYTAPTGTGTFGFTNDNFKVNEAGGNASLTVERIGGSTGAADVNYTITPGTASLADFSGPTTGTVHFADGQLFGTISIPIVNDTALESNETLNVALSGTGLTFSRSSATLTIRDDDFNTASPAVILNEMLLNSPGNDGGHEFVELAGTPGAGMGSLYFVVVTGAPGVPAGASTYAIDLGAYSNGSSGMSLIRAQNTWDFSVTPGVTQITTPLLDIENLSNDTASYLLLYSPNSNLPTGSIDLDWNNDGTLDLPAGVVIVDSLGDRVNTGELTYGPAANTITTALTNETAPNKYAPDAVSRFRGNTTTNDKTAWYYGDLFGNGDDQLVYHQQNQDHLPSVGDAATPGEINAGTPVQSPLVSLTAVTPNLPAGTVTVTFSGPITQVLKGGPGITITSSSGAAVPGVNTVPVVSGLGTSSLTLTFTGGAVVNGQLPPGQYRLNFVGDSLIGNQRAVDVNNNGALEISGADVVDTAQFTFTQPKAGDVDQDTHVDVADVSGLATALSNLDGYGPFITHNFTPAQVVSVADVSGDHVVNNLDLQSLIVLLANGGGTPAPAGGPAAGPMTASGPESGRGGGGSAAVVATTSLIVASPDAALPLVQSDPQLASDDLATLTAGAISSVASADAVTSASASIQALSGPSATFNAAADLILSKSGPSDARGSKRSDSVLAKHDVAKYLAPAAIDLAISTETAHHGRHSSQDVSASDTSVSHFFQSLGAR
jgi:hypothetical protein